MKDCQIVILGQILSFDPRGRPTTIRLGHADGEVLGLVDYHAKHDAYTSNVDQQPKTLLEQLEQLVRSYQMKRRQR